MLAWPRVLAGRAEATCSCNLSSRRVHLSNAEPKWQDSGGNRSQVFSSLIFPLTRRLCCLFFRLPAAVCCFSLADLFLSFWDLMRWALSWLQQLRVAAEAVGFLRRGLAAPALGSRNNEEAKERSKAATTSEKAGRRADVLALWEALFVARFLFLFFYFFLQESAPRRVNFFESSSPENYWQVFFFRPGFKQVCVMHAAKKQPRRSFSPVFRALPLECAQCWTLGYLWCHKGCFFSFQAVHFCTVFPKEKKKETPFRWG